MPLRLMSPVWVASMHDRAAQLHAVVRFLGEGHVHAVLVEHRHGRHLVRGGIVAMVGRRRGLRGGQRMPVQPPDVLQQARLVGCRGCAAIRGARRHTASRCRRRRTPAVCLARRPGGRTPTAVRDVGADAEIVAGHQLAGVLVEHDQRRGFRVRHVVVRPLDALGRTDVEQIAVEEDRAVGAVVRRDAQFGGHVVEPEDVGVLGARE